MKGILNTKKYLTSQFKMEDLSEVDTILDIRVKKYSGGYVLCQSHYIDKVLLKFNHIKNLKKRIPHMILVLRY